MFVEQLLNEARKRLVTIQTDALLVDAAEILSKPRIELVVVCDSDGRAVDVLTKTDIVRRISHCEGAACHAPAAAAMSTKLVCCRPDDLLSSAWGKMKQHGLRHIPIIDAQSYPPSGSSMRETH